MLSIGRRKHCVSFYDNEETEEPSEVEMTQGIDCEGVDTTGLRYPKPDIAELGIADFLSEQEVGVLRDNLVEDIDAWLRASTAYAM
jgi:hypothetical protein